MSLPGGFDFLGYHFEQGKRSPRRKSLQKLKDKIRERTRRANGHGLEKIIEMINPILRGWFVYFQHSQRKILASMDAWVRRRLRSILRTYRGSHGIARGADYQRWPNAYFRQLGLFTLAEAHALLIRSLHETHQPESRMREIRTFGSEGGGAHQLSLPL